MNPQFRNIDSPNRPRVVSVVFSRLLLTDATAGPPDEQDEGFWPSRDSKTAGYIGDGKSAADLEAALKEAHERMAGFESGAWHYVGVICRATIHVPIGGDSFTIHTIDSAGLWGIESDAGDYLQEVYAEEESALRGQLRDMGAAFVALPEGA
jgi:hypothetical protein